MRIVFRIVSWETSCPPQTSLEVSAGWFNRGLSTHALLPSLALQGQTRRTRSLWGRSVGGLTGELPGIFNIEAAARQGADRARWCRVPSLPWERDNESS